MGGQWQKTPRWAVGGFDTLPPILFYFCLFHGLHYIYS
jgi:hypothetical protein